MVESYLRRVRVENLGGTWKIMKNEVPEGNWPLVQGARETEASRGEGIWAGVEKRVVRGLVRGWVCELPRP